MKAIYWTVVFINSNWMVLMTAGWDAFKMRWLMTFVIRLAKVAAHQAQVISDRHTICAERLLEKLPTAVASLPRSISTANRLFFLGAGKLLNFKFELIIAMITISEIGQLCPVAWQLRWTADSRSRKLLNFIRLFERWREFSRESL